MGQGGEVVPRQGGVTRTAWSAILRLSLVPLSLPKLVLGVLQGGRASEVGGTRHHNLLHREGRRLGSSLGVGNDDGVTGMRRTTTHDGLHSASYQRMAEIIGAEDRIMAELVGLFDRRVPFEQWSDRMKAALVRALDYGGSNEIERSKADHLRRHLFLDASPPGSEGLRCEDRLADRVRADLAGAVPFGAGLSILDAREDVQP